jgi:arginase
VNASYAGWEWEILGVPIDCSGRSRGEERGPSALRAAGLSERLRLSDRGDVEAAIRDPTRDPETGVIGFADLRAASAAIKAGVAFILGREARPLVIGGCCSLLPGAIAGAREAVGPTALAFVDGHLDFYDGNTSDSGEAADMDLAILTGWGPTGVVDSGDGEPLVEPADAVVVGYRDEEDTTRLGAVDPAAVAPEMLLVHARDVLANGAAPTGEVATRWLESRAKPIWLHLDLDVLDEEEFPAVTYPRGAGLSWNDVLALARPFLASPRLVGIDVTDFNADRDDDDGLHARRAVDALRVLLGR